MQIIETMESSNKKKRIDEICTCMSSNNTRRGKRKPEAGGV
jgi:hypothetical protein